MSYEPDIVAKAPFNFTPLPPDTFYPGWAGQVSSDVPFDDGLSGSMSLLIRSDSDIFVRNGHTQPDADAKSDAYKSFSRDPDGRYFIPATSLKGSIRSVLEIMSFSAMTQVNDSVFGQRDLNSRDYRMSVRGSLCGWLRMEGGKYILCERGEPERVKMWQIDKDLNLDYVATPNAKADRSGLTGMGALTNFVLLDADFRKDYEKCARRKYEVVYRCRHKNARLTDDPAAQDDFLFYDDYLANMRSSDGRGVFVLTGQPGRPRYDPTWKKSAESGRGERFGCWTNKVSEFLFPGNPTGGREIEIDEETFRRFAEVHKNSLDFTEFWGLRLRRGLPIPVFYHKRGERVEHMGLSYMYKLPFRKSVTSAIRGYSYALENRDMARCIFGDTQLRGRVMFGNAYAQGHPTPKEVSTVSGAPHASYYPLYMRYGDWNQKDARVAGWKRYPARQATHYDNNGTDGMTQVSRLLPRGTRFLARVRFFNLRPAELGALLSAITWHADSSCRHSIGFGKPYGYGVCRIEACLDGPLKGRETELMQAFQDLMDAHTKGGDWLASDTIRQLMAMARPVPQADNAKLSYLRMSTRREENEFLQVKRNHEYLKLFTLVIPASDAAPAGLGSFRPLAESASALKPAPTPAIDHSSLAEGGQTHAKCVRPGFVSIAGRDVEMEVEGNSKKKKSLVGKLLTVQVLSLDPDGHAGKVRFVAPAE